MKVLVTGAAGYIGSVLVPLLLEKAYEVVALDRFFFGREKLPAQAAGLSILEDDIRCVDASIFKDIDSVIDLAALSNDPCGDLDTAKTYSINHLGRVRIATLAKSMGAQRYILPSSCSIYGFQDDIVNESSQVNPLTAYAKANYMAENDIIKLADNNFCVTVLRQATVYGLSPRMRFDLAINGMIKGFFAKGKIPILRDGTQWRPFVHVRDTSQVMIKVLEADKKSVNKQIFNVGCNEQNYKIFQLAEKIAQAVGIDFAYEWYGLPDHRSYRADFTKIKNVLKFRPSFDAEKGAQEVWWALKDKKVDPDDPKTMTVNWYKKLLADGVCI